MPAWLVLLAVATPVVLILIQARVIDRLYIRERIAQDMFAEAQDRWEAERERYLDTLDDQQRVVNVAVGRAADRLLGGGR